jgi:Domain of unknown function (DUF1824)
MIICTISIPLLFLFLYSAEISSGFSFVVVRKEVSAIHRPISRRRLRPPHGSTVVVDGSPDTPATKEIEQATAVLSEWDKLYNTKDVYNDEAESQRSVLRPLLAEATMVLNVAARLERERQIDLGRCMLGICASSTTEGITTLKAWVTALQLPRGLLHGLDVNGVPVHIDGGVYIKYNSGGVYTFADIRKSQMGFDALWKPGMLLAAAKSQKKDTGYQTHKQNCIKGDAMLEQYTGDYRGVYFQVELSDGAFRQFLLPLDTFENQP